MFTVEKGVFGYDKNNPLLNEISFTVPEGKILTILGPNGAGKTTLLKCMVGLLKWQKGQSFFEGTPISRMDPAEFWKHVSYVPQAKSFAVPYSVLEMVVMGRAPYIGMFSAPGKSDYQLALEVMEDLGIAHLQSKRCSSISGGELQLALIARALVSNPRLVILDEPESYLDFRNQLLVLERLQQIAVQRKIGCVINTHYPENAFRISNLTLMLGKGGKYIFGDTKEIITEEYLREFFGVRVRMVPFRDGEQKYSTVFPVELAEQAWFAS